MLVEGNVPYSEGGQDSLRINNKTNLKMKKYLLIALLAAMPVMAQDRPEMPEFAPHAPGKFDKMARPEGQRPELTEEQKAEFRKHAPKAGKFDKMRPRRGEGKDFGPRGPKRPEGKDFGPQGPRRGEGKGFGPQGPRGQRPELTEEQKAEMKARFGKKGEGFRPEGPRPDAPEMH